MTNPMAKTLHIFSLIKNFLFTYNGAQHQHKAKNVSIRYYDIMKIYVRRKEAKYDNLSESNNQIQQVDRFLICILKKEH